MISGIDIVCGIVVLVFSFFGLRAGFLSSFLSLLVVYFSIFFSAGGAHFMARNAKFLSVPYGVSYALAFFALFIITIIVGELIVWALKKIVAVRLLGILDTAIAIFLGTFRALLIMGVVFTLVVGFPISDQTKKILDDTRFKHISVYIYKKTYPFAEKIIPKLSKIFKGQEEAIKTVKAVVPSPSAMINSQLVSETVGLISKEVVQLVKEVSQ
ncbi:MAG: CvpA family protein [Candidatus Saganbacteria bacterium]|nr:CvpA family protein [Candidatus Saganbacteria bacterium]